MANEIDITVHLLALQPNATPQQILTLLDPVLIKGVPHGWVHSPHGKDRDILTHGRWDLFIATEQIQFSNAARLLCKAQLKLFVTLTKAKYDELEAQSRSMPAPSPRTTLLPKEWQFSGIPDSAIQDAGDESLKPGELRLDLPMATYLRTALPATVANKPVSLYNLFKYKGNRSVHDDYMEGFKAKFGDAAGAAIRFMGATPGELSYHVGHDDEEGGGAGHVRWDDANLVQYDTIWHYAYMLSTNVYRELNRQKVAGLDDTCILCVSELELSDI